MPGSQHWLLNEWTQSKAFDTVFTASDVSTSLINRSKYGIVSLPDNDSCTHCSHIIYIYRALYKISNELNNNKKLSLGLIDKYVSFKSFKYRTLNSTRNCNVFNCIYYVIKNEISYLIVWYSIYSIWGDTTIRNETVTGLGTQNEWQLGLQLTRNSDKEIWLLKLL